MRKHPTINSEITSITSIMVHFVQSDLESINGEALWTWQKWGPSHSGKNTKVISELTRMETVCFMTSNDISQIVQFHWSYRSTKRGFPCSSVRTEKWLFPQC